MRTARAKGLSQGKSLFKHALRNAILPVVTYLGPALAYTLTGSLIVEKIFKMCIRDRFRCPCIGAFYFAAL